MMRLLKTLHEEDGGQDLIEYAIIAVIISLSALAGMASLASSINQEYTKLAGGLPGVA